MNLSVGRKAVRRKTILKEDVESYAKLTGDYNPLHFNESFAANTKFKKLTVQGGITTGLIHALVAMNMPGPGTVFLSQEWKFIAPVFIGDKITAEVEVVSIHDTKPVTELNVVVTRNSEEKVLEGRAWCYTFSPGA